MYCYPVNDRTLQYYMYTCILEVVLKFHYAGNFHWQWITGYSYIQIFATMFSCSAGLSISYKYCDIHILLAEDYYQWGGIRVTPLHEVGICGTLISLYLNRDTFKTEKVMQWSPKNGWPGVYQIGDCLVNKNLCFGCAL